jgi:hypothetical protein
MRAMESRARNNGWSCVVSDTTDNVASANKFSFVPVIGSIGRNIHGRGPNKLYGRKSFM